jgi:hypothetical protein
VDEHGFVLDILFQRHRDTEAAKTFLTRLLGEYDVPEVIHADQLRSYGAAIREIPSLLNVDHQQVISTARCNNIIEQRASVVIGAVLPKIGTPIYPATRAISAGVQATETRSRIPEFACPDHQSSPSFPHQRHYRHLKKRAGVLKGVRSAQETTRSKRSRRGQWSRQGWSEVQATPALSLP